MNPGLDAAWQAVCAELAPRAARADIDRCGDDLIRRWSQPHRRYHTARHLTEVLAALADIGSVDRLQPRDLAVARMAAWFHDAVYDPSTPDGNEAASAKLAGAALARLGVDAAMVDLVAGLVRASADHAGMPDEPAARAFHDADLWILAAPTDRFDEYCEQVRSEYRHVPLAAFRIGRAEILTRLAASGRIYRTVAALPWETRARDNISRELDRLRAR